MSGPICASCDRPLEHVKDHRFCNRCAELAQALSEAERQMREAKALLDALDALQPTVH